MPDRDSGNPGSEPAFDALAAGYDARSGLPSGVGQTVAEAIVRLGRVSADDLVLELGAGTGEIGTHLAALPTRYVGMDTSPAMLEVFRTKASPESPRLLVGDADSDWPLPASSTRVIFASRVIHLLLPEHVAREATRVCQPGGYVMLGRVNRDPDSLKERLRHHRQYLLREAGIQPRQGESGSRQVIERLAHAGWTDLGRQVVAAWTGDISVAQILAEWGTLSRMGSVEVESPMREHILGEIREWAGHEFGNLDRSWPYREQYMMDIAQLPEAAPCRNA